MFNGATLAQAILAVVQRHVEVQATQLLWWRRLMNFWRVFLIVLVAVHPLVVVFNRLMLTLTSFLFACLRQVCERWRLNSLLRE